MDCNFKINKKEKFIFYNNATTVNKYDYLRYVRGGGKYIKQTEDEIIHNLLKLINKKNLKILDCPAGTGRILNTLKKFSKNITCVDNSKNMINYTKKKYPKFKYILSSADNLKIQKNSIDTYVSLRFFFHFKDLEPFFKEAARVIKNQGHFIFDVFNWSPRTLIKARFIGGKTFNHNFDNIMRLSKKYKFKIIKEKKEFIIPTYIATFMPYIMTVYLEKIFSFVLPSFVRTKSFYILKKIN